MNLNKEICIIAFDAIDQILYYSKNNCAYQMPMNKTITQHPIFITKLTINDLHYVASEKHDNNGVLITAETIKPSIPKHVGEYFHEEIWTKTQS